MQADGRLARACAAGFVVSAVLAGSMSGCSSNADRDRAAADAAVAREHDRLRLAADAQALRAESSLLEVARYREHLLASARESAAKDDQIASLQDELARLQGRHDALGAAYNELADGRPRLPGPAVAMLRDFARTHGELLGFAPDRTALLLRNDLTFQAGTDALTREAAATLAALTALLNDPRTADLDVRVVVHADAKPIADAAHAAQLRREGWELSNRRAVALGRLLASAGVSTDRLTAYGDGARHPLSDNATPVGRSANRRVEICFTPRTAALPMDESTALTPMPSQPTNATPHPSEQRTHLE